MTTLKYIKEYLPIIILVATLIGSWTTFHYRLSAVEKVQAEQSPLYLNVQKDIVEIQKSIVRVETTLEFIRVELLKLN